jgi:hypothetical protein
MLPVTPDPNPFITTCEEDEEGNLVLIFPDLLLESQGWHEGTVLEISAEYGKIVLREVSPSENIEVVNGN